jgi:hypothetical protein
MRLPLLWITEHIISLQSFCVLHFSMLILGRTHHVDTAALFEALAASLGLLRHWCLFVCRLLHGLLHGG